MVIKDLTNDSDLYKVFHDVLGGHERNILAPNYIP